jgi:hypothetical protein
LKTINTTTSTLTQFSSCNYKTIENELILNILIEDVPTNIKAYEIYYSTTNTTPNKDAIPHKHQTYEYKSTTDNITFVFDKLDYNTTYYFWIRELRENNTGEWYSLESTTLTPSIEKIKNDNFSKTEVKNNKLVAKYWKTTENDDLEVTNSVTADGNITSSDNFIIVDASKTIKNDYTISIDNNNEYFLNITFAIGDSLYNVTNGNFTISAILQDDNSNEIESSISVNNISKNTWNNAVIEFSQIPENFTTIQLHLYINDINTIDPTYIYYKNISIKPKTKPSELSEGFLKRRILLSSKTELDPINDRIKLGDLTTFNPDGT